MKIFNANLFASGKAHSIKWIPTKRTWRMAADKRHGFNGMSVWMDIVKNTEDTDGIERLIVDVKKDVVEFREAY